MRRAGTCTKQKSNVLKAAFDRERTYTDRPNLCVFKRGAG